MWAWSQDWRDLLFLHWRVPVPSVLPHVPAGMEVETRDGFAWVSLVFFRMSIRPWWFPFLPDVSHLTEVNFRTYVRCAGRQGVYFLSMHADNRWAIRLARLLTPLPYVRARLHYQRSGAEFSFEADRLTRSDCQLSLRYRPVGECWEPSADSLEEWLLERYRAFAVGKGQKLLEAEVCHPRWTIRNVAMSASTCRGGAWWPLAPSRPPDLMHFATGVQALFGRFRQVARQ